MGKTHATPGSIEVGEVGKPVSDRDAFNVEEDLTFLLGRAKSQVASLWCEQISAYGIPPPQLVVLMHLEARQPGSLISLSQQTGIDRTTIAGIVHRLGKKRLATCRPSPGDRRAYQAMLTEDGVILKSALNKAAEQAGNALTARISPTGYEKLIGLLAKLVQ